MMLQVDAGVFADCFPGRAFTVEHGLAAHPLLQLDALAGLADTLPADLVEHNRGDVPLVLPGGVAPRLDQSPGAVVRGLEENACWISLRHIERVAAYRALVDATLDDVMPAVRRRQGRVSRRQGFVFLAASGAVTPVHCDPEHNFLLQLRGTKTVSVGEFSDPEVVHREMERQHQGGHRNLATLPDSSTDFLLEPGVGIYIPPDTAHSVTNGPGVSASLSLTFYTPATVRAELVHGFNARLRRAGRSPRPPGQSVIADRAKATGMRVWRAARRLHA